MGLTLGRAGKTLALPEPSWWDVTDGQCTVSGYIQTSPATDALRLRDQILGYQDNWDEPIIPVTVGAEPRLTGYYRVTGVRITTDPEAVGLGYLGYEMGLQPVMGFAQPLLESVVSGSLLTNAVSGVSADALPFHAVPSAATEYQSPLSAPTISTRASADGILTVSFQAGSSGYGGTGRYALTPANFYIGAATFEQGSALQPVVGRLLAQADSVNWRLSNAFLRVTPNATPGKLDISRYNGTSWSAVKTFALQVLTKDVATDAITTTASLTSPFPINAVLATFKPAAASTIARVGALGAFTVGTNTAVTGTFGQATSAGNLLIAWVTSDGTGTTTAAAGWAQAQLQSASGQTAIWYKKNCGAGEAAPGFTSTTGSTPMHCQLAEFSGADTAAPLDKIGAGLSPASPSSVSEASMDAGFGWLLIQAVRWRLATSATATFVDTFNNGAAAVHSGDSGGSSLTRHSSFSYGITTPTAFSTWNSVSILRNSVEEVGVRLSLGTTAGISAGLFTVDLSLRRGELMVRLYGTTSGSATAWIVARDTAEAATAIAIGGMTSAGIRATADDAAGNRYVLVSYQTSSPVNDLTNGSIKLGNISTTADFGIGLAVGNAGTPDDPTSIAQQYLAAQSESQRVVAR